MYAYFRMGTYPVRAWTHGLRHWMDNPASPFADLPASRSLRAGWQVVDELTRRYAKPEFGLTEIRASGEIFAIEQTVALEPPFAKLMHFRKRGEMADRLDQPKVHILAPLSGHFSTLVRATVSAMAPEHDVYLSDWADARGAPLLTGRFDLADFIDCVLDFLDVLVPNIGPEPHVIANWAVLQLPLVLKVNLGRASELVGACCLMLPFVRTGMTEECADDPTVYGRWQSRMLEPFEAAQAITQSLSRRPAELDFGNFELDVHGQTQDVSLTWSRIGLEVKESNLDWSDDRPLVYQAA